MKLRQYLINKKKWYEREDSNLYSWGINVCYDLGQYEYKVKTYKDINFISKALGNPVVLENEVEVNEEWGSLDLVVYVCGTYKKITRQRKEKRIAFEKGIKKLELFRKDMLVKYKNHTDLVNSTLDTAITNCKKEGYIPLDLIIKFFDAAIEHKIKELNNVK